jgi:hypothetical protein
MTRPRCSAAQASAFPVERQAFSRRRIQHHHLLGYFKHRNARFSRCGKTVLQIRTTHNSQSVETKRLLRTGEARSRSINLKARALAIASRPSVSANLAGSPRSGNRPPSSALHWINLWTRGRFCIGSALLSYRCCGLRRGSMSDNCRANLEACWLNAERASSERERRAWLEMAAAWRLLVAIGDPPSPPEYCVVVEHSAGRSSYQDQQSSPVVDPSSRGIYFEVSSVDPF